MRLDRQAFIPGGRLFTVLSALFITHALLGEAVGGKLFDVGPAVFSMGTLLWPVVFVSTDLLNEYFGRDAVMRLSRLTALLIGYEFTVLYVCMAVPTSSFSPVSDAAFRSVFGTSLWLIVGSLIAFLVSQIVDARLFDWIKRRNDGRRLWLRTLGSTAVSQLVDTFLVNLIAFGASGKMPWAAVLSMSAANYGLKALIALLTVPMVYVAHGWIDRWLERQKK